jgi:hypothetical protein
MGSRVAKQEQISIYGEVRFFSLLIYANSRGGVLSLSPKHAFKCREKLYSLFQGEK